MTSHPSDPPPPPAPPIPPPRRRVIGKWWIVAAFWAAQTVFFAIFVPMWSWHSGSVNDPKGNIVGTWKIEAIPDLWSEPGYMRFMAIFLSVLTLAQAALLWPVRRPRVRSERGLPVQVAAGAAGLGAAVLFGGCIAALVGLGEWLESTEGRSSWEPSTIGGFFVCTALAWSVAGFLLFKFYHRRLNAGDHHEDVIRKLASRLFMGTIVEAAAIIPLDVMLRRKTNCYCETGTFWALSFCWGVGGFVFGPWLLVVFLARRRKSWYASRCDACGYDMSGLIASSREIDRCPECGSGWKTAATGNSCPKSIGS